MILSQLNSVYDLIKILQKKKGVQSFPLRLPYYKLFKGCRPCRRPRKRVSMSILCRFFRMESHDFSKKVLYMFNIHLYGSTGINKSKTKQKNLSEVKFWLKQMNRPGINVKTFQPCDGFCQQPFCKLCKIEIQVVKFPEFGFGVIQTANQKLQLGAFSSVISFTSFIQS